MAKNFLEGVNLKQQSERNGFDMSYQNQFTAPFGMMLPFFFQRVNPDDKLKLACESQTICDGLAKPAFMRLREHLDYYFIPATQLWMPFDNFVTGQNSYFSNIVAEKNESKVPNTVPTFTLDALGQLLTYYRNNNVKDEQGWDMFSGTTRLLDHLGYFNFTRFIDADLRQLPILENTSLRNFFPILCYQKVYYDYFRNDKYEANEVGAYNIDDLESGKVIQDFNGEFGQRANLMFGIHYRWAKKDYFTQVSPQVLPQGTDIGYTNLQNYISTENLFNVPGIMQYDLTHKPHVVQSTEQGGATNKGQSVWVGSNYSAVAINANQTTVTNIRFAFAYDRLLRRMREAGPDFDSQMLAQFGVKPFDARHGKCTYLGGYTNRLSAKDVTNTTGNGIGDLAGQINSYNDNSKRVLKYHAKEHGYVIGIYSTSVDNMYQSFRCSRETRILNRFDWFNPAFQNLGKQPIFMNEYDYTYHDDPDDPAFTYNNETDYSILGYVPRYSELKTHPDECHGLLTLYLDSVGNREWNVQMNTKNVTNSVFDKTSLQLDPSMFDNVAGIEYDGSPSTDHFVVNIYNHSHKVSTMSVYEEF